ELMPCPATSSFPTTAPSGSPQGAPTEAVTLRAAQAEDADALALVGAATFLEAFTWMLPGVDIVAHCAKHHTATAYRSYLAQPDTRITLAVTALGGAPVGYAMLTAPELPTFAVQPTDIELKRIYLFSRFRSESTPVLQFSARTGEMEPVTGLRAGQALMEAAVADARGLGRTRLLLGTHAGNTQAISFYRKNGFAEAGTRTFQVGAQVCCDLIFAKLL
ncbi:MAG TPA: GNAT family N-acetyltransferase, partial [Acidobacteriaceae bacterium]|nr:GNAT family N-acetyltransferase [Acidobacteriaceae bacterium]